MVRRPPPRDPRVDVRVDPLIIRATLRHSEHMGVVQAARLFGVDHSQVYKWRKRREQLGGDWPSDADVELWHRLSSERREQRERGREHAQLYRRRRYLNQGPLLVPALGVIRRLRALQALGWTQGQLGEYVGMSHCRIGHLTQGHRIGRDGTDQVTTHVHVDTWHMVDQLYRKLCMTLPPNPDHWTVRRQRDMARKKGWSPPLAWDDIDDPHEHHTPWRADAVNKGVRKSDEVDMAIVYRVLQGEHLHTTRAEKEEIMRRWTAAGKSERSLCKRMGWKDWRYSHPGGAAS